MEEALRFFRAFEVWIYLLLGLGGLFYIRKFALAWQELRGAGFGLERESAQRRLNQSASVLVLLLTMAVTEFVLVSFIAPAVPGATPLLTPTLDLLATPTTTLPALTAEAVGVPATLEPGATPAQPISQGTGCVPGQIEITSPQNGQEISSIVPITGTADIPNFGFYQFKMKLPTDPENLWATIQAGNAPVNGSQLGFWDTRRLLPGDYQLALVVVDNEANVSEPCVIQVRVAATLEETPGP